MLLLLKKTVVSAEIGTFYLAQETHTASQGLWSTWTPSFPKILALSADPGLSCHPKDS